MRKRCPSGERRICRNGSALPPRFISAIDCRRLSDRVKSPSADPAGASRACAMAFHSPAGRDVDDTGVPPRCFQHNFPVCTAWRPVPCPSTDPLRQDDRFSSGANDDFVRIEPVPVRRPPVGQCMIAARTPAVSNCVTKPCVAATAWTATANASKKWSASPSWTR